MEETVDIKRLLSCAIEIGKRLVENGAEIDRVESTIEYICNAYGGTEIDVFAIPTMISATLSLDGEYYTSKIKRIRTGGTDFFKVEKLNELSRYICSNKPTVEEIEQRIKHFDEKKPHPFKRVLVPFGAILGCAGFAVFFGGTFKDGLATALVSLLMAFVLFINKNTMNRLVDTFIVSVIGGFTSVLTCKIGIGDNIPFVMIGSIMMLIPGMAIGTAFKDFMMDDILSGTLRFIQATLKALVIAIGYSIAIALFVNDLTFNSPVFEPYIILIVGVVASGGYAFMYDCKYENMPFIIIGALIVNVLYLLFKYQIQMPVNTGINVLLTTTICAGAGALFAEIVARVCKTPAVGITTPVIIILAPGASLYYCMQAFWKNDIASGGDYLLKVLFAALGIGAGIVLGSFIIRFFFKLKKRIFKKKAAL